MQLKFKNQRYQEDATAPVVPVFQGQPKNDVYTYLRDKGQKVLRRGMESLFADQGSIDEGYANAPLRLSPVQLLDNVHRVQRANNIQESGELHAENGTVEIDVEMETGTGKTSTASARRSSRSSGGASTTGMPTR